MSSGKKFLLAATVICIAGALIFVVGLNNNLMKGTGSQENKPMLKIPSSDSYRICRDFVCSKLIGADTGVYTNYLDQKSVGDMTKGHNVLCESQGLLMLYAQATGNKQLFDRAWGYVSAKMLLPNGLIAWRVDNGVAADSNATIDDLRVAYALCNAYRRFHDNTYLTAAKKLSASLLNNCVKTNLVVEGTGNNTVLQSYVDLGSMNALSSLDSRWRAVLTNSVKILNKGRVSASLPFYREQYDTVSQRYVQQTQYPFLSAALIMLYQSEIGKINKNDLSWLLQRCENQGLFAAYSMDGRPITTVESSALYAITMLIAENTNDGPLYRAAQKRLTNFQVKNKKSVIYGAFGNENTLEVYSFDNLFALFALTPKK